MVTREEIENLYKTTYNISSFDIENCNITVDDDFLPVSSDEKYRRFTGMQNSNDLFLSVIEEGSRLAEQIKSVQQGEEAYLFAKMRRSDGKLRDVMLTVKNITNSTQKGSYIIKITDIINTDKMLAKKEINSIKYSKLLEMEGLSIFEYDFEGDLVKLYSMENTNEVTAFSKPLDQWIDEVQSIDGITAEDRDTFCDFVNSIKTDDNFFNYTFQSNIFTKNTDDKDIIIKCSTIVSGKKRIKAVGIIKHQDGLKNKEAELLNIRKLDIFTGLYNKKTILDFAERAIKSKKYDSVSLVMLDLDNFKLVNDNYGHMKGDEVIKKIASIIKNIVGSRGYVGRFGGDEYFIVLCNIGSEGDLRAILKSIQIGINESYEDCFKGFNLSASIGVATYPQNGEDFDLLFKKADRAAYIAKKKGKKRYILYKEALHGELDLNSKKENKEEALNVSGFVGDDAVFCTVNDIIQNLMTKGEAAVEPSLKTLITIYRLGGISIYRGDDFKCVCRMGTYITPIEEMTYMKNKDNVEKFNGKYCFRENNAKYSYNFIPDIHNLLAQHNITSTVQCIMGSKESPRGLMTFDNQNGVRRWSEEECQFFTIIAQCINTIYCQKGC